jgi:hypothetical protein
MKLAQVASCLVIVHTCHPVLIRLVPIRYVSESEKLPKNTLYNSQLIELETLWNYAGIFYDFVEARGLRPYRTIQRNWEIQSDWCCETGVAI